MSDGECQEGMTWECVLSCAKYKTNIIAFIDYNGIQIDGYTKDIMDLGDLAKKFESFNWLVQVVDGHSYPAVQNSFLWAVEKKGGPRVIIFRNVPGKGVSFMENNPNWHGVAPNKSEFEKAMVELNQEQELLLKNNREYQKL